MIKSIKYLLVLLTFPIFFSNSYGQYAGGNGGGAVFDTLVSGVCTYPFQFYPYFGGNMDGSAADTFINIHCSEPPQFFAYFGGNSGGSGYDTVIITICSNPTQFYPFFGGQGDGYSFDTLYFTNCNVPTQLYAYFGGNNDGFSNDSVVNSVCQPPPQFFAYFGGNNDGFSYDSVNHSPITPPVADFNVSATSICLGEHVVFSDQSNHGPIAWSWKFTGTNVSTSSLQNPTIVFSSPGTYTVKLTSINCIGADSIEKTGIIVVHPIPQLNLSNNVSICAGDTVILHSSSAPGNYHWSDNSTDSTLEVIAQGHYYVTFTDNYGCSATDSSFVNVQVLPIADAGLDQFICNGTSVNLAATGGSFYSWSNGVIQSVPFSPSSTGTYTVTVTSSYGCKAKDSVTIFVVPFPPLQPDTISGNRHAVAGNFETYRVNNVQGVSYTWTAPSGWVGSGSADSIVYLVGIPNGVITVTPSNTCGNGPARTFSLGYSISGNFYYYNPFGTPLDSLTVLLFRNGNIVDSAISDPNGNYVFERLADATYNIQAKTHKTWSGVNATDAVKVKRHFAGSELFNSSIRLHAADVNISLNINTSDAVKITRRFVGSDTSFVQQDWIFEKPFGGDTINISPYFNDSVTVNGGNVHQDFTGLCTGDVNGSNVPLTGAKQNPEISIDHIGSIGVKPGNYFEIPVRVSEDYSIGAISMILKFPAEKVKVENVRLSNGEDVVYRINGDELRLGWFSKDRILDIRKNSDLLILFLRSELSKGNPGEFRFDLKKDPLCELADANGEVITNASMYMPFVFSGDDASIPIAGNPFTEDLFLYPNPANDELTVNYSLFADGNIKLSLFNMIGEKVIEILNNYELKGVHNLNINLGTLPAGVYKCRMLSGEGQIIRTLVILR